MQLEAGRVGHIIGGGGAFVRKGRWRRAGVKERNEKTGGLLDSIEPISFFEIEIRLVSYPDTRVWGWRFGGVVEVE